MGPLAGIYDLIDRGYRVPAERTALAMTLLESVSAEVRDAAGTPISVTVSTVDLPGTREQFLPLPGGPIRSVESVDIEGLPVTDYKIRDGRLWRARGWGAQSHDVTVTWEHGLVPVPADIVNLVCSLAGAGLLSMEDDGPVAYDRRMAYERIADYQYGLRQGDSEVVDVTEVPDRTRRKLAERFSGSAFVVGTY